MPTTRRRRKTEDSKKPHVPPFAEGVKPGTDFYKYINGNWIRHVKMPPYMSSYGVSEEIEDGINKQLMDILLECRQKVRNNPDKEIHHTVYLLGTLTESALNIQTQDLNVKFLKNLVGTIRCIRDTNDLASTIADFMKYRINCVFSSMVVPPEEQNKTLRFALSYGNLGLPDPLYYENEHSRIVNAYLNVLKKLSVDFDIPGLESVVALERNIAFSLLKSRGSFETLTNGHELKNKFSAIPWDAFFKALLDWTPSEVNRHVILLSSTRWFAYINKLFRTLPIEQWKLLLSANLLLHFLPLLPPPYDDMDFELFGRRLRGQTEKIPQNRLALRLAQQWLTGSLGYIFVKRHVLPSTKDSALSLTNEILNAAIQRIGVIDWLDIKTRHIAQKKLKNMELGIGYPSVIEKDRKTHLNPERLIENVIKLSSLDFQDEIQKIDTALNRKQWDEPIFAVNAYYYNESNHLILPAGILQWPFFDVSASDGWNFGGLGSTIGHEICHAFDNEGKEFDETGNRKPWWDRAESMRYLEKTKEIVKLYNKTEYFGKHLNGVLTLSENIADLGGVAFSLAALKNRLNKRRASAAEIKKEICDFFISYAVSWRTKEKKEKAIQSLFMDVHAPPMARVNNIVCQFDDWYECFDIKPGDALYKSTEQRIRIF